MINREIPKNLFIGILNSEFGDNIKLEDILTCYEIACGSFNGPTDTKYALTSYDRNRQVANNSNSNNFNKNYGDSDESSLPIFNNLDALVNPENVHDDNRLKYEADKLIEGSMNSNTSEVSPSIANKKIFDEAYGEVLLGNLTYVEYLADNPGIADKQRAKLLIKTLMGYRGFGRYLKRNGRLLTINSLLLMQSDSPKLIRLLEKKYIKDEELTSYIGYFNKGCDILVNMTNYYMHNIKTLLPGVKIPEIYMYALVLFSYAIRFGYTNEQIFYGILRPTDFDQTVFRREKLVNVLKTFQRSSMYMLVIRTLEYAEGILEDLEHSNTENEATMAMYFTENLKEITNLLAFVKNMAENFNDNDTEVESLVADVDKSVNYKRMKRCYYDIKAVLKDEFVGTSNYNSVKISKILELFDGYASSTLRSNFDRKVVNSDSIDLIGLGNEILEKIIIVLEEYK